MALFFRRHESPFPALNCALKQIDPAALYEVTTATAWQQSTPRRVLGAELVHLTITIPEQASSQLLEYNRV